MFEAARSQSRILAFAKMLDVIFHVTVRNARKGHTNALTALAMNMLQGVIFVAAFYVMFTLIGIRKSPIRGDFLVYIMSGIFIFMTNIKTMSAVAGAEGPASPMMQHGPMNTFVSIFSAALGSLYLQSLTVFVVLFIYDIAATPLEFFDPVGVYGMLLLAWFNGVSVGLIFMALQPWLPKATGLLKTVYSRANMIASGKMFVANALPASMLALFSWNPLFHIIDQARGFAFVNYTPNNSSLLYPLVVSLVLLVIGFIGESYTRKYASISWSAR